VASEEQNLKSQYLIMTCRAASLWLTVVQSTIAFLCGGYLECCLRNNSQKQTLRWANTCVEAVRLIWSALYCCHAEVLLSCSALYCCHAEVLLSCSAFYCCPVVLCIAVLYQNFRYTASTTASYHSFLLAMPQQPVL